MAKPKTTKTSTNLSSRLITRLDNFQRSHAWAGFPFAVIKKYGDDQSSYQAALITYYGFLSLFPLLMVAVSITQLVAGNNPELQRQILDTINSRFPALSDQLTSNVQASSKTGLALVVGLLLAFYGAKGVADALQQALNHIWQTPKTKRTGFPKAALKSLSIILVGGLGLFSATVLAAVATGLGNSWIFTVLAFVLGYIVTALTILVVINLALSRAVKPRKLLVAALVGGFGIQLLQVFGTYLVQNQIANASSVYGTFAIVLGLLFWIYLQTEVFLYAVEANTVYLFGLWPRALDAKHLTEQDKKAYNLYTRKERYSEEEMVDVSFS